MRVHRLITILLLIESRGLIKAKELASKLEISLRTVYRDIDTLCEAGIPITTKMGPNGGIHLMEGWTGGLSQLHEDELVNLYLSGIGLIPDRQSEMSLKLKNALLKLEKNLSHEQSFNINKIKERFYFDESPWWGNGQRLHNIDVLFYSVLNSCVIKIEYKKVKGESSIKRVRPYGIVIKNKVDWYMIAYCEENAAVRTYKCERIIKCEVLSDNFTIPEDFSLEGYWNKAVKEFKNLCQLNEKYPVVLKINKNRLEILTDFDIYEIKEEKNDIKAIVNMYDYQYAKDNIVKLIGYVEVIKPLELRNYVKKQLKDILMKHKS